MAPLSQGLVVACRMYVPHICGLMGGRCHVLPDQKGIAGLWRALHERLCTSDSCVELVAALAEAVSKTTNFDCKWKNQKKAITALGSVFKKGG